MWASSTSQQRQLLWARLARWAHSNCLPINPDTACLFVLATGVSPQAQLAYTKALSGAFRHIGITNVPLLSLASALRATGAAIPVNQAPPVPKECLIRWALTQRTDIRLAVIVAWKTASRWAEVADLSSDQFILVTSTEVIIDWHATPKGRRANPFTPSKWAVIRGDLTGQIASIFRVLAPFDKLTTTTTSRLSHMWDSVPSMARFSGHSIKRGAVTHLFSRVAQGVPIDVMLICRLAKHSTKQGVPDMTVRYGGDGIPMARALQTGLVTVHL
ncbi:hypothetical protein DIPPA_11650 [Diplonema papillatum]|nr:hypothetical protein DIPPA_05883 [Diplonema papillatum]KAJ9446509.1 hypothetical protein DIPPA_13553 [Diplonema papillatum]KAJ9457390.1 hypothetical protein DIPPA_26559 [Diplonema papillatum]KAJ9458897.1 hypothetical protein DIPPA_03008 [Diplonema papillatum]KAJ9460694.1 hypothetical protein DIPPA_26485 [Diplonema papillatum]